MSRREQAEFRCRVCGAAQAERPWGEDGRTPSFDICHCCGVEFGYEDSSPEGVRRAREAWERRERFKLHDTVVLTRDVPEASLTRGTTGAIVAIFDAPSRAFEVEFVDRTGGQKALVTLPPAALAPRPWCPACGQGWVVRVRLRKNGVEFLVCDECDSTWLSNDEIGTSNVLNLAVRVRQYGLTGLWTEFEQL